MTKMQQWHTENRERTAAAIKAARAFVAEVRAETRCAKCGAQPVEWHREEHVTRPSQRISTMAGKGYAPEKIHAEMLRCEPLCRRCHVRHDGRIEHLKLGPTHPSCRENRWPEREPFTPEAINA